MKKISLGIVVMLMISMIAGSIVTADTNNSNNNSPLLDQSHAVLGEFGTATWCGYCKYAHGALKALMTGGWHDFYYVSLVDDKNTHAEERIDEHGITGFPTVYWDGDYLRNVGAGSIPSAMTAYNASIISCGNRNVDDLDLTIDVTWLGSATMDITVTVDNNEDSSYSGYLRCYVCEIESSMGWYDTAGDPYTFPFLDYAFDQSISISASGTWTDTVEWDGADYNDGYGNDFGDITEDNTFIVASVFASSGGYVDQTAGKSVGGNSAPNTPSDPDPENEAIDVTVNPTLSWTGGDPEWYDTVYYDVYFEADDPTPDVLVSEDQTSTSYDPGTLEFETEYYWKIVAEDNNGAITTGPTWSFTTRGNEAPNTPSDPDPEDDATDIAINNDLSWTGGDPDGDDVTYDIYFGESNPPPKVKSNHSSETYDTGTMDFETKYYWKIVAWDIFNYSTEGPIWSFTTEENLPPYEPTDPDPMDGETDVAINARLYWTGGDPNEGDPIKYDIYFGTTNPPPLVYENLNGEMYNQGTMDIATIYYWKIVARDSQGLEAEGDVWEFTTELAPNQDPEAPDINGEENGKSGDLYDYTFSAKDPEGGEIYLWINWGDGNEEEWLGPYDSEEEVTLSHSWEEEGKYTIKAKAKDDKDAESDWGYLEVEMPFNKAFYFNNIILNWIIERFPNLLSLFRLIFS
jgi:hypothetical protein